MPLSRVAFLVLVLFLTGCLSRDEKIVDLAGAVFLIFLALIGFKYATRRFANSRIFINVSSFLHKYATHATYPVYFLALVFILTGIIYSGIHRIQIFSGLVVAIIGFNIKRLSSVEDDESKSLHLEIISLGISILIVLTILWGLGSDLFSEFSLFV